VGAKAKVAKVRGGVYIRQRVTTNTRFLMGLTWAVQKNKAREQRRSNAWDKV